MLRLQQTLIVLGGLAVAVVMVALGLWQLGVYQASGNRTAAQRAAAAPLPLGTAAPPGAKITNGFGRSVTFAGTYDPALQETIPLADSPGRSRVLTGLRLDDGRLVAVVRGTTTGAVPAPPTGRVDQVGVLLPSENSDDPATSVRVPLLAQHWPGALVEGYVNLNADLSIAQGLDPAPVNLPAMPGRFRNGAYALQWWLFAAFALLLATRMARDLDRGRDLEVALAEPDDAVEHSATASSPADQERLRAT
jgi:surfeit locus 1 family protein